MDDGAHTGGNVFVQPLSDRDGVRIVDPIERRQIEVTTDRPVEPRPADTGWSEVPLDTAASVAADRLVLPWASAYVRDVGDDRRFLYDLNECEGTRLEPGQYELEVCAPIKLYVRIDGALEFDVDTTSIAVSAVDADAVRLGARSHHEQPAGTITTSSDPRDVMRAVSLLGSALKTTSPERSFPTLRGHPPDAELGEGFDAPDWMERPGTGLHIELPRTHAAVYAAAPLAYYLGAEVVPGSEPRLTDGDGFEHWLGPDYEREVERVLKQSFLMDCVVRTEGLYPVDLHERRAVLDSVDRELDLARLYEAPLADRLATYLSIPWESVADHVPTWKLAAHVEPTPDAVQALPFLVADLAVVRSPSGRSVARSEVESEAIREFMRGTTADPAGEFTRSAGSRSDSRTTVDPAPPSLVRPEETVSLEQAWLGEDAPLGANKLDLAAFRNRLDRNVTQEAIDITVVCNDESMLEEHDDVADVYGSRDDLPFDVVLYENLTTDRLRLVLETESDFLHYIGHIESDGFDCPDGLLDARGVDRVGVDAFFLNACASYEQGMALLDGGAVGGVVTLDEVINSGAVTVGRTIARLLNRGFPLRGALDIARDRSVVGAQYVTLGDGNVDIAHSKGLSRTFATITSTGTGYDMAIDLYADRHGGMGTMFAPAIPGVDQQYLVPGHIGRFELTEGEIREFLSFSDIPVLFDGEFRWSGDIEEL